ncbi:MAG: energy-coupling factor transporter transmembrane protein EcfT, partial [Actinomycetota bacterium]|nr:energy-coupling factor transporter transmembrane protein EcfT [Actinomycetota bacterium]
MDPSLYLERDTWVHRLDPRTKMFLLLGTFVLAFAFLHPLYLLAVLVLVLFFGYLAKALVNLRRIWFILVTIAILTIILWSIFGGGQTPLFLFVEWEALLYGISIALRI